MVGGVATERRRRGDGGGGGGGNSNNSSKATDFVSNLTSRRSRMTRTTIISASNNNSYKRNLGGSSSSSSPIVISRRTFVAAIFICPLILMILLFQATTVVVTNHHPSRKATTTTDESGLISHHHHHHRRHHSKEHRHHDHHHSSNKQDLESPSHDASAKSSSESGVGSLCVNDPSQLPKHWQPPDKLLELFPDSGEPWSKEEEALADEATRTGLDELVTFFAVNMTETDIIKLGTDAVNSLIDEAYASDNMGPDFMNKALTAATRALHINAKRYVSPDGKYYTGCKKTKPMLKYVAYGQYLLNHQPNDAALGKLQTQLVNRVNRLVQSECKTLEKLVGVTKDKPGAAIHAVHQTVQQKDEDELFGYCMTAISLIDCMTVPNLHLPNDTDEFIAAVMEALNQFHYPNARASDRHYREKAIRNVAWLATHAAYVPTGYGRHQQQIRDSPWLYEYVRENYYYSLLYALERNYLDLVSEFIDLVRQFGCTEENDVQLRHGTRYLLKIFQDSGHSWMNYIAVEHGNDKHHQPDNYEMIHIPWTAISGVSSRQFEPIVPGSYGYAYQQAMQSSAAKKKKNAQTKE